MEELINKLKKKAFELRKTVLEMCLKSGTGHLTSSLSCTDILTVLYYANIMRFNSKKPKWSGRDWFILSKAQASPILYALLADLGYFDKKELKKFAQKGGIFGIHLQNDVPGVEITAGSLGQGFSTAAGIALGLKMDKKRNLVFALLGDGECYEGSIWEAAMFTSHHKLNNLIAIIDRNYICATDFTEHLIKLEPLEDKWLSLGWEVVRINGHDIRQILSILENVRERKSEAPLMIIADTVKGKGIDYVSNNPYWHGLAPTNKKEIKICRRDLERGFNAE